MDFATRKRKSWEDLGDNEYVLEDLRRLGQEAVVIEKRLSEDARKM